MALELDTRQRAMLQEMGVRVWLPGTEFSVATAPPPSAAPPSQPTSRFTPQRAGSLPQALVQQGAPVPTAGHGSTTPMAPSKASAMDALDSTGWPALQQAATACQACGLCAGRRNTTLVSSTRAADWMVVGDPPDEDEDGTASPFAGPSGVLLDNMLAALGLRRSNRAVSEGAASAAAVSSDPGTHAYITNVVKCRPPHGAQVQAADLAQCSAYLQREIALVQPKMILAMGRFAHQLLLGETPELANQPLGKLRGVVRYYRGVAVVPTYHPKALMRTSADKAKAWADLCLAADALDAIRAAPGA